MCVIVIVCIGKVNPTQYIVLSSLAQMTFSLNLLSALCLDSSRIL